MSRQQSFEVELREHDLPPTWDGLVVVWRGWETLPEAFICPPPRRECCSACGSTTASVTNRGRVAVSSLVTREHIAKADVARSRLPFGSRHKVRAVALYRLTAFRCPDCKHDVVVDNVTGETWDLDGTDYGTDGSMGPT